MDRSQIEIAPDELSRRLKAGDAPLLVDVRTAGEHAICALPSSKLLPLDQLPGSLDELPKDEEIVLYCHHGMRSMNAAIWLQQQGWSKVKSLAGGIDRWSLSIDPKVPRY